MTNELFRPVSVAKIGSAGFAMLVRASQEECATLAARMGIPSIQSLECFYNLTRDDDGVSIHAEGRLRGRLTRKCIVSAEDFETTIEDEFSVLFVPSGQEKDDPNPELPDEVPYDGDLIDLGEATAEQLGLSLDPYPRIEGATAPDFDSGSDGSPFSVLARRNGDKTGT